MSMDRDGKMVGLKRRIERGEYRVDPQAVADAILRRADVTRHAAPWETRDPYNTCSYPESGSSESTNTTPLGP
jgi:Anti-sigma-28 factor, FlgM